MTRESAYCSSSSDCDTCECGHVLTRNGHVYCYGRGEYHPPVRGCGCYQPIKGLTPTMKPEPAQPQKLDSELLEKHTVLVGGELGGRFLAVDEVLLEYVNIPKTVGTKIELQYRSERDGRCVFGECGDTSDNLDRIIAAYETRDIHEIYGAIRNAISERTKR